MCQCAICPVSSWCGPRCATIFALLNADRKLKIGGRRVDRVRVQDHQPLHLARIQVGHQRLHVARSGRWAAGSAAREDTETVLPTLPSAELIAAASAVTDAILIKARNHRALARAGLQVLGQCGKKLLLLAGPCVARGRHAAARRLPPPAPPQTPALRWRAAPGDARPSCPWWSASTFDRVKPVQLRGILAPRRILAHQLVDGPDRPRPTRKSASSETITSAPREVDTAESRRSPAPCPQSPDRTASASPADRPPAPLSTAAPAWAK